MTRRKSKNFPVRKQNYKNQNLLKELDRATQETNNNEVVLKKVNGEYYVIKTGMFREESYYSGPLPSPEVLEKYDQLYPGTAKNFIDDYREVLKKNVKNSEKIVNVEVSSKKIGSWTSAIFVIGSLGVTIFLGMIGLPIPAAVSALTSLGGLYFAYLKHDD